MGPGYADLLQTALAAVPGMRLVEREKLAAVLREQALGLSGLAEGETAVQVGRLLGADRLLSGSFLEMGESLRIEMRLTDTATGSVLRAESTRGPSNRADSLVSELAPRLSRALGLAPPKVASGLGPIIAPARKLESLTHMKAAEDNFDHGRYADACEGYRRVLLLDPDNHYAYFRLAAALWRVSAMTSASWTSASAG